MDHDSLRTFSTYKNKANHHQQSMNCLQGIIKLIRSDLSEKKSSLNQRVWEITVFVRPLRGAKLDLNKRNQYTTATAIAKPKSLANTTSESLPILILSIQS